VIEWIGMFLEAIKPFKSALVYIRANYDRSIILYFEILQQMFTFTFISALLYAYLVVTHYLDN
jgi:hypothetical protein